MWKRTAGGTCLGKVGVRCSGHKLQGQWGECTEGIKEIESEELNKKYVLNNASQVEISVEKDK